MMDDLKCGCCGHKLVVAQPICPRCGTRFSNYEEVAIWKSFFIILAICVFIGGIIGAKVYGGVKGFFIGVVFGLYPGIGIGYMFKCSQAPSE